MVSCCFLIFTRMHCHLITAFTSSFIPLLKFPHIKKGKKERIAVIGIPSHSYGTSLAIWDHCVTCHPTQVNAPALTPASRPVLDLPTAEGWKADLT